MVLSKKDIESLSLIDRLELISELWETIDHDKLDNSLSEEVKSLLDERLQESQETFRGIEWQDLKAKLDSSR